MRGDDLADSTSTAHLRNVVVFDLELLADDLPQQLRRLRDRIHRHQLLIGLNSAQRTLGIHCHLGQ